MRRVIPRADPHLNEGIDALDQHLELHIDKKGEVNYRAAFASLGREELAFVEEEVDRCAFDLLYYLENYHVILADDGSFKTLFPFWGSQDIFYGWFTETRAKGGQTKGIVLKGRQEGLSTLIQAIILWLTMFNEGFASLLVAHEPGAAGKIFDMSRRAWEHLPWWMRPEKRYEAMGKWLVFDRDDALDRLRHPGLQSSITVQAANKITGVGVGQTYRAAHMTEIPRWVDPGILNRDLLPTLHAPDLFAVMESTAVTQGDFWQSMWNDSLEGRLDWDPIFIPFYRRPEYSLPIPEGEKFVRTPEEDAIAKRVKEETPDHFVFTDEIFNWRRVKIAFYIATEGDEWLFRRDYPCLVGGTRVPTENGLLRLDKCSEVRSTNDRAITAWVPKGRKPVFRATTSLGYHIIGTADHVIPSSSGDTYLSDLVGKRVFLEPPQFAQDGASITWRGPCGEASSIDVDGDYARFLGYFMGDGCYHGNTISIVCDAKDQDVIADVERLMKGIFGRTVATRKSSKAKAYEVRTFCPEFADVMRRIGCYRESPPHRIPSVPEVIFQSPKQVIAEFLRGLFEADGFNGWGSVKTSLFAKHEAMLRDVQLLLLGFGITSRLSIHDKTTTVNGRTHVYTGRELTMRAAESRLFNREIGFIGSRKRARSEFEESKNGRPITPITMGDTVVSVEPCGEESVYDITTTIDHCFSANGIKVHNCTDQEAFQASGLCAFDKRKLQSMLDIYACKPRWVGEIGLKIENGNAVAAPVFPGGLKKFPSTEKLPIQRHKGARLFIWEGPEPGARYQIGGDVAQGIEGGDFSSAQVFKISRAPHPDVQVAEWHGWIKPTPFAHVLAGLGYFYNTAEIACEANDVGKKVNDELVRGVGYPKFYRWKRIDKLTNFQTDYIGWETNIRTRPQLIGDMGEAVDGGAKVLILRSEYLIKQMMSFGQEEPGGRIEGQGEHDDRVMSACITFTTAHELEYGNVRQQDTGEIDPSDPLYHDCVMRVTRHLGEVLRNGVIAKGFGLDGALAPGAKIPETLIERESEKLYRRLKRSSQNYETAFSPVFDKAGPRQDMHFRDHVPPEMILLSELKGDPSEDVPEDELWKTKW